ncbi:MAG: chemotaxis response regulator protein-glutamate methylesterase [Candidatus Sulfotelmatobacter sp.]|jgi:two-component system chemotaxis response regulator CheB
MMQGTQPRKFPVRVLVADDSAFMRTALRRMLESDPDIKVIAMAQDGRNAVELCEKHDPDVVTLDLEMPVLNGLQALQRIMQTHPRPVIMVSSLTTEGAETTLEAFSLGAFDCIPKPMSHASLDIIQVREDLVAKVKAAFVSRDRFTFAPTVTAPKKAPVIARPTTEPSQSSSTMPIVCLGCSTGGPAALQQILPALPADLPAAIVIVQHMPVGFTGPFARRLNSLCDVRIEEAKADQILEPGCVLIAPAGFHLTFSRKTYSKYSVLLSNVRNGLLHMPSVDVMMNSAAQTFDVPTIAVILTGMGADGAQGMKALHARGAFTIGQDERTCVVYGMPRACAEMGILDRTVPLDQVAGEIVRMVPKVTAHAATAKTR